MAVTQFRGRSTVHNPLSNLRTPGLLARWPLIGLIMVVLGLSLFGVLAISLQTHSPLLVEDVQLTNDLHVIALQSSPAIRDVMIAGFYMGEHVIIAIGLILALYFLYKRFWPELAMVVIAWSGEGLIWTVLSQYFDRTRPIFAVSVWRQMQVPSFPSGHSMSAVMCYGLLAYLLAPRMPSRFWKVFVSLVALLIIVYIGFSRLFVGDHFVIDVLAGYGLGIAWFGLVFTTVELIARRIARRKNKTYP